jgi:hypothetical protein
LVKTPIVSTRFGSRTVVIDEFPGDDNGTEQGEGAPQVATWLATATVDDVEDLTSVQQEATTLADSWVREWLTRRGRQILARNVDTVYVGDLDASTLTGRLR